MREGRAGPTQSPLSGAHVTRLSFHGGPAAASACPWSSAWAGRGDQDRDPQPPWKLSPDACRAPTLAPQPCLSAEPLNPPRPEGRLPGTLLPNLERFTFLKLLHASGRHQTPVSQGRGFCTLVSESPLLGRLLDILLELLPNTGMFSFSALGLQSAGGLMSGAAGRRRTVLPFLVFVPLPRGPHPPAPGVPVAPRVPLSASVSVSMVWEPHCPSCGLGCPQSPFLPHTFRIRVNLQESLQEHD